MGLKPLADIGAAPIPDKKLERIGRHVGIPALWRVIEMLLEEEQKG
jgi:hypothetical protein